MQPNLCQDQINALAALEEFITAPFVRKPYFVLHGLAGTGKTFLLAILAQRYPEHQPDSVYEQGGERTAPPGGRARYHVAFRDL